MDETSLAWFVAGTVFGVVFVVLVRWFNEALEERD